LNGTQDVTTFFAPATLIDGELTVHVNETTPIEIRANSDEKEYDGLPLINSGYGYNALPAGVTNITAVVEGSQTDVGNSPNRITGYKLWRGTEDITHFFKDATLINGTLTVKINETAEIVITANSDEKQYDGTPLTNDGFGHTVLPAGVTSITTTIAGSQTDVGESENVITAYRLWNGTQDVTDFFKPATLIDGELIVTPNETVITLTANSGSKVYDGAPLTNGGVGSIPLPPGVTHITTTVVGAQTGAGSSPNTIVVVTLWNGTQDVTEFFPNINLNPGVLTVTPRPISITAGSSSRMFNGTPLMNGSATITAGSLAPGQTLSSVAVSGSQTAVGSSANIPSAAAILSSNGINVTANYAITYNPGVLIVTAVPFVPTTPGTPGTPTTPDDPEETIIPDEDPPLAPEPPPVVPQDPAPEDPGDDLVEIEDDDPPLAPGPGGRRTAWALWNLILSVAGALLAIAMGIRLLIKRRREDEEEDEDNERMMARTDEEEEEEEKKKRNRLLLILAIPILAIIAIIVFIITQDMRLPMRLTDWWTLLHVILFVVGLICYIFAFRRKKDEEDDDPEEAFIEDPQNSPA